MPECQKVGNAVHGGARVIVENLFKLFVLYIMIKVFDPAENECYTAKSVFGTNSF